MLVAAAVCPAAPLLVPDLAGAAAPELDECRSACRSALATVLARRPDVVVVVGAGRRTVEHDPGAIGTLRAFGVDLRVELGSPEVARVDAAPTLPASVTVGAWLLARLAWTGAAHGLEIADDAAPGQCRDLGRRIAAQQPAVALLVMADGSARRGPKAPGYVDARADSLDQAWVDALADPDPAALAALDPATCDALMMQGRPSLQVLAGAAGTGAWSGEIHYRDDPYGVEYAAASWTPADDRAAR